jgi:hypothetical protein
MQLQLDLPETLALQLSSHLDQSAEIIAAGLSEVLERSYTATDSVPDVLDFLDDLHQRCDWMRQVLELKQGE